MPSNVRQLLENGVPVYPITERSLVIGLQDAPFEYYVVAWDGASTPVVANIPAGVVVTYSGTNYTGTLAASATTAPYLYLVASTTQAGEYDRYIVTRSDSSFIWTPVGSTAPITPVIVDNLTTNDATKALSAKQGKVLGDELSELEQKVNDIEVTTGISYTVGTTGYYRSVNGNTYANARMVLSTPILLHAGECILFNTPNVSASTSVISLVKSDGTFIKSLANDVGLHYYIAVDDCYIELCSWDTNVSKGYGIMTSTVISRLKDFELRENTAPLYNSINGVEFHNRDEAAVTTAINDKIDVSSIPDGAQIVYRLLTASGDTDCSVSVMNSDSFVMVERILVQGGVFYTQKTAGMKFIRTYKSAVADNIANYTITYFPVAYPIDFRDFSGYARTISQSLELGKWLIGNYPVGGILNPAVTYFATTPMQFTRGAKIRITCTDFSSYKVYLQTWSSTFQKFDSRQISAQTDINLTETIAWNIQFRRNDYANISSSEKSSVVTVTYLSGEIYERSATKTDVRTVAENLTEFRESRIVYDDFSGKPFYYHFAPNGLAKDGQENKLIGGQSADDIRMAARLGFSFIEANIQKTSDNKYICMHGNGGKFGQAVISLDNTDISGVSIASKTLAWIKENVRFDSDSDKYKTAPLSLEEFCEVCRENRIGILAGCAGDATPVSTIRRIMGNNVILYNAPLSVRQAGFGGWMLNYKSSTALTVFDLVSEADSFGKPYICSLGNSLYEALVANEQFDSLLQEMHNRGHLIALSYLDDEGTNVALRKGVDTIASSFQVNPFGEADKVYDINGDTSEWGGTGSISNNTCSLGTGQTIIIGDNEVIPLGKGYLSIKFNGSLSFSFGSEGERTLSSSGDGFVVLSDYFLRRSPKLTITATAATEITELLYKVAVC